MCLAVKFEQQQWPGHKLSSTCYLSLSLCPVQFVRVLNSNARKSWKYECAYETLDVRSTHFSSLSNGWPLKLPCREFSVALVFRAIPIADIISHFDYFVLFLVPLYSVPAFESKYKVWYYDGEYVVPTTLKILMLLLPLLIIFVCHSFNFHSHFRLFFFAFFLLSVPVSP